MKVKVFVYALPVLFLAIIHLAEAQQGKKVFRIGYLSVSDPATESTRSEAIRLALRELGYIEGQTSPSSTDMRRGRTIGTLSLPPSWCVSRLISS